MKSFNKALENSQKQVPDPNDQDTCFLTKPN